MATSHHQYSAEKSHPPVVDWISRAIPSISFPLCLQMENVLSVSSPLVDIFPQSPYCEITVNLSCISRGQKHALYDALTPSDSLKLISLLRMTWQISTPFHLLCRWMRWSMHIFNYRWESWTAETGCISNGRQGYTRSSIILSLLLHMSHIDCCGNWINRSREPMVDEEKENRHWLHCVVRCLMIRQQMAEKDHLRLSWRQPWPLFNTGYNRWYHRCPSLMM